MASKKSFISLNRTSDRNETVSQFMTFFLCQAKIVKRELGGGKIKQHLTVLVLVGCGEPESQPV